MKNNTLTYRVGELEKKVERLDGKIDELMVNHLPHIHKELVKFNTRLRDMTILNVSAIILGIIVSKLFL